MKIRDALKGKLTKKEMGRLKAAFDTVGSIAILEIPPELEKKESIIAKTLLGLHKNIKTVVKKSGAHTGEFRLRKVEHLAGERTTRTVHKESGCEIALDIEKVYFSVRLSTERLRIANLITTGEDVLVMFCGCAPYPCVLSKMSPAKHIVGIELNKEGYRFGKENVRRNRLTNVTLKQGDVRDAVPKLNKKFDRTLMPLPKNAGDFLDVALAATKKGGLIHFYDFLHEKDIPAAAIEKVDSACRKIRKTYRVLSWTKCGSNAPREWRICLDVQVL